jgi:hypothetical protein
MGHKAKGAYFMPALKQIIAATALLSLTAPVFAQTPKPVPVSSRAPASATPVKPVSPPVSPPVKATVVDHDALCFVSGALFVVRVRERKDLDEKTKTLVADIDKSAIFFVGRLHARMTPLAAKNAIDGALSAPELQGDKMGETIFKCDQERQAAVSAILSAK